MSVGASIETEIREGLAACEFEPFLQPIVRLADFRLVGFEALARWNHPRRGLVQPVDFVRHAEAAGLIRALDFDILAIAWASLDEALETLPPIDPPLVLSANLSADNLRDEEVLRKVEASIAKGRGRRSRLQFELTETLPIDDASIAGTILEKLKALGVAIALDDFGTGYSSLAYLHRFPVDCIKIDRSFSEWLLQSQRSHAIVRSIIDLARSMGIRTVAEGIEEPEIGRELLALGCESGQGILYGEPIPTSRLAAMLSRSAKPDTASRRFGLILEPRQDLIHMRGVEPVIEQ